MSCRRQRLSSYAAEPEFVREASKRGVFAYITDRDVEDWQSSIDIVLRRFADSGESVSGARPGTGRRLLRFRSPPVA